MSCAGDGSGRHHDTSALRPPDWERLERGGDIRGMPLGCDYCDQPAAWAAQPLYDPVAGELIIWLACENPRHIARAGQEKLADRKTAR